LREDKKRPEPAANIIRVFLLGGFIVFPAYLLEKWAAGSGFDLSGAIFPTIFIWAAIEETLKYGAVYLGAFRSRFFDEPVDAMVYMITAALGFAAVENTFFMLNALSQDGGGNLTFLLTGNFRFIGASVVHIVSSAIVGALVGLYYYGNTAKRVAAAVSGLAIAISLHALFNYSIIVHREARIMTTFVVLWLLALLVIFLFEKVKATIIHIKTRQTL
jgi:RsiW-degrading membrane proteinase PrsW (M82 family)